MIKNSFFRILPVLLTAVLLQISFQDLKGQKDVLDLYTGTGFGNCLVNTDLTITKNLVSCDADTAFIIKNIRGRRSMAVSGTDWQYRFCGEDPDLCSVSDPTSGRLQIMFKINGVDAGIKQISFQIQNTTFNSPIVRAYQGASFNIVSGSLVTGRWYSYEMTDNTTPFDSVVVISPYDDRYTSSDLFILNSVFLNTCPSPSSAGVISGPGSVCQGQTGVVYTVPAICNAKDYIWNLPSGASISSGDNTNSITVSFSASASSGNITVYGTSSCGNGSISPACPVTVNPRPGAAGALSTGTASVCRGQTGVTYTVPVIANATGYAWNLPPGATITAGANTNSITVSFSTSASSGNITVNGTNSCGSGSVSPDYPVTVNSLPGGAGSISGTPTVCQGQSGVVYTVPAISNATGYAWTLPSGANITSGTNTNSITVSFSASAAPGNITVQGTNSCGSGTVSPAYPVSVNPLPGAAGSINGTPSVCQGQSGVVYTVPAISGATGYAWTLPSGANITTGTNTNSITVSFSASAASGNITVQGTNSCGSGTVSAGYPVTVNTLPAASASCTGPVCTGNQLSLTGGPDDMTAYSWTGPNGFTSTDQSPLVSGNATPAMAGTYNLTVTDANGCQNNASVNVVVTSPVPGALPEVICLYDLSWSMNRDFNDNNTSVTTEVKLFHAKNALIAFTDLLYSNNACQSSLGLARFPDSPQTGCYASTVETSKVLNALYNEYLTNESTGKIQSLVADGNSTPLLAGVNHAITMFSTSNPNKTIVLLTDGRQNCPYTGITADITNTNTALKNAGIKLFTVGFGDYGIVPEDILLQLVSGTGGTHYNINVSTSKLTDPYNPSSQGSWNAGSALNAVFANIIKVLLGQGISDDPLDIINLGEVKEFDIPVTVFDEKVCFFVSWITPQENYLDVRLITPSGTELSAGSGGFSVLHRKNHTIITLYDALLSKPGMRGTWKLRVDGTKLAGSSEHYQHTVLNTSKKIDFRTWFDKERYFTGNKILVYAGLFLDEKPLPGLSSTVISGTGPRVNPGDWLISKKLDSKMIEKAKQKQLKEYLEIISAQPPAVNLTREGRAEYLRSLGEEFLKSIDPTEVRVHALKDEFNLSAPGDMKIAGLKFSDNGRNGDKTAGDGIYTAAYVPKLEGRYGFNISFSDINHGEKILRESHMQTYVSTGIRFRIKKVKLIDQTPAGDKIYAVTFTLKDKYGNNPMPFILAGLDLSAELANLLEGIIDNMDGTFTQKISLPSGSRLKEAVLKLSAGEFSGSRNITAGNLKVILPSIALAVIALVLILSGRKKKK